MPKHRVIRIMSCHGYCRIDVRTPERTYHIRYTGRESDYLPTVRALADTVPTGRIEAWPLPGEEFCYPVTIDYRDWPM